MKIQRSSWIYIIATIFLLKVFVLGFFVIPLWDIPDEIGHYAYARDLAEGAGVPLLGKSMIKADIVADLTDNEEAGEKYNWIAQHPPAYYFLAAIPIFATSEISMPQELRYRIPRIVAMVCGALALIILYKILVLIGLGEARSVMIVAAFSFIPRFSNLAAGTNHDVPLLFFSAIATYYLVKLFLDRHIGYAYLCAVFLALSGFTKLTALVLIPPVFVCMVIECSGSWKRRIMHSLGLLVTALSLPAIWLVRNWIHFQDPFYVATSIGTSGSSPQMQESLLEYLDSFPVFQHFIINFIGAFGWQGTGKGVDKVLQLGGLPALFYLGLLTLAVLALAVGMAVRAYVISRKSGVVASEKDSKLATEIADYIRGRKVLRNSCRLLILAGIGVAVFVYIKTYGGSGFFTLIPAILVGISGLAVWMWVENLGPADRLQAYGVLTFLFFGSILLLQVYDLFLYDGRMRATWGRYFYPVVPIILVSIAYSVLNLRIPALYFAPPVILMAGVELYIWIYEAIPFFHRV